ncbi:MAG: hypothetical protein AAGF73_03320 [Actinomycetota bacterium]
MPQSDDDELTRLRSLVGPSERAYDEAIADADRAIAAAKQAAHAAGEARGALAEMRVELARARQEQDLFQRRRTMSAAEYLIDLGHEAWSEVVRPRLGRARRSVRSRVVRGRR